MSSQRSTAQLISMKSCNSDKKKQFINWLQSMKDITFKTNAYLDKNRSQNKVKERQSIIKKHIQNPNLYVWQDFLNIFQLTSDQVEKLNLLLHKGFSFISKDNIPQNIRSRLGHDARKMNLKRQYQLKEAQQVLENPVSKKQSDLNNSQDCSLQQTKLYSHNDKHEQFQKKQDRQSEERQFQNQNKVVLMLKRGQKRVEDLSVFAHPRYQKMHNIVVFKRMLHPNNYSKQKQKQIKKQREDKKMGSITEDAKINFNKISEKNGQQISKKIEYINYQQLKKKNLKQGKNNRNITIPKKSSKNVFKLQNPKLNLQLAAVKQLMQKLQKHEYFVIFLLAETPLIIKCLLKTIKAKIQKNYKVHQFETDILRLFKVYYKFSNEKSNVMRNFRNYQKYMKNLIQKQKMIFNNPENQAIKIQQNEIKIAPYINATSNNKALLKMVKYRNQQYKIKDLQLLGKNLFHLNQVNTEQFCAQFCSHQNQKLQGQAFIFQFDFNKENTTRLIEMGNYVSQKLDQQKTDFVDLSDEDFSGQFIIENDD